MTQRAKPLPATAHWSWPTVTATRTLSQSEIDWDEPYNEGGPDAAHERLRALRLAF